jgi:hypothetical protein
MKNIFYFIIALMLLVGCADIKEESDDSANINTKKGKIIVYAVNYSL